MSNFRLVFSSIWTGKTGREVRKMLQKGKYNVSTLYYYLLTCPNANQYGVYYLPLDVVSFETGLAIEQVKEALIFLTNPLGSPLEAPYKGNHPFAKPLKSPEKDINNIFCSYDPEHEYVWIHNMTNYQIKGPLHPSDKQVIGANNFFKTLPKVAFLKDFYQKYYDYLKLEPLTNETSNNDPNASPLEAPCKPLGSTNIDTNTDTDTNRTISIVEQARQNISASHNIVEFSSPEKKSILPVTVLISNTSCNKRYENNGKKEKEGNNQKENKHLTEAKNILAYLNQHAGTQFREVDTHFKFILARLEDGANPEQCIDIINRKIRAWKNDPSMSRYLRPKTLFNKTNFEQYIGECIAPVTAYHNLTPGEKYLLAVSAAQEKFLSPDNRQIVIEH